MTAVNSVLANVTAQYPDSHYYLAFSGGLDSTVLLHALSQVLPVNQITAIHIHHGLLAEADGWVEHCLSVCQSLGVNCRVHKANVKFQSGDSVEEVARNARYHIFAGILTTADILLTAHHADDQAETFLLNALRGSGMAGLSAMPLVRPLAAGLHCRPLLSLTRQQLSDYAVAHKLSWIEDPSNKDDRFSRNYLRKHIMPLLRTRWPKMASTFSRSATLIADNLELLTDLAILDTGIAAEAVQPLSIEHLCTLSQARRFNALRYWLKLYWVQQPSLAVLTQIDNAIFAQDDANPEVQLGDVVVRRYQQMLYCSKTVESELDEDYNWDISRPLVINENIHLKPQDLGVMLEPLLEKKAVLSVSFRQGGERMFLPGREHQHQVKKLLQERAVPPWLRDQLPMIYYQDRLIAILGLSPPILGKLLEN